MVQGQYAEDIKRHEACLRRQTHLLLEVFELLLLLLLELVDLF